MKIKLQNDMLSLACSAGAVALIRGLQNALFLTADGMPLARGLAAAVELFASLCLFYFSLKSLAAESRFLFAAAFSPALAFSAEALAGVPFNALALCSNILACLFCCASLFCAVAAFGRNSAKRAEENQIAITSELFSAREKEVIALMLLGKTAREAAEQLFISEATVKTHLQHIYEKAGVKNRAQLALFIHKANK